MKEKKAFSLIEVVIATSIITIAVFWVYKLIWENTKIINNSSNLIQVNSLFPALEECIENIWFNDFKNINKINYFFNFWNNLTECGSWSLNTEIDNVNYIFEWIITNSWSKFIDWELQISSEQVRTMTWFFKQIKY